MNNDKKKQNADKFIVRLPEGMREKIAVISKTNHRSMNSEIVSRLEHSFEQESDINFSNLSLTSETDVTSQTPTPLLADPTTTFDAVFGSETITRSEKQLLTLFRHLSKQQQQALLTFLKLAE